MHACQVSVACGGTIQWLVLDFHSQHNHGVPYGNIWALDLDKNSVHRS